jgi:hypothetical protein
MRAPEKERTMNTNRNALAGVLAAAALAGLAYSGVAVADDTDSNPAHNAPRPGEATAPATQGRTLEPTVERIPTIERIDTPSRKEPSATKADKPLVDTYVRPWPAKAAAAARAMIESYGQPNEATPSMLVWQSNGQWKRTIVYRDEVQHNFPRPHVDVLEQFVEMRVPLSKIDDLLAFDGSITVHRTEGLVSVRCQDEAMSFVAINLAYDIAHGKKTALQARTQIVRLAAAIGKGETPAISQGLLFEKPAESTAEPDKAAMKAGEPPASTPTQRPAAPSPAEKPSEEPPGTTPGMPPAPGAPKIPGAPPSPDTPRGAKPSGAGR